jgi:hypothetical protein
MIEINELRITAIVDSSKKKAPQDVSDEAGGNKMALKEGLQLIFDSIKNRNER